MNWWGPPPESLSSLLFDGLIDQLAVSCIFFFILLLLLLLFRDIHSGGGGGGGTTDDGCGGGVDIPSFPSLSLSLSLLAALLSDVNI